MKENSNDNFSSVVAEFGNLISDFGFSCPKKLWYPNLVSLSKNIQDIYYCYVITYSRLDDRWRNRRMVDTK